MIRKWTDHNGPVLFYFIGSSDFARFLWGWVHRSLLFCGLGYKMDCICFTCANIDATEFLLPVALICVEGVGCGKCRDSAALTMLCSPAMAGKYWSARN